MFCLFNQIIVIIFINIELIYKNIWLPGAKTKNYNSLLFLIGIKAL